jgi:hypothetical protein
MIRMNNNVRIVEENLDFRTSIRRPTLAVLGKVNCNFLTFKHFLIILKYLLLNERNTVFYQWYSKKPTINIFSRKSFFSRKELEGIGT